MIRLQKGTLWQRMLQATARAQRSGALRSIATRQTQIEQAGLRFIVRQLQQAGEDQSAPSRALAQKNVASILQTVRDPFLPYDAAMFVADVSPTHVCLLNKFNVVPHHLLVVTRAFESQETLLSEADFAALWLCMAEFDALAFYNGGKVAGASQNHKHLQLVPLPLADARLPTPLEPALTATHFDGPLGVSPQLPFVHAVARVDPRWLTEPASAAAASLELYLSLLAAVGLQPAAGASTQAGPYNLLITRQWMWLAPRSRECVAGISVNSLGFAGSLFVRDETQLQTVQRIGPLDILLAVGKKQA